MKNWLAGFADSLLPDPISQRAIDETIQDYREERALSTTLLHRIGTDVRYVAALMRVFCLTGVRDLAASDTWRVVASCLALSLAVVTLLLWVTGAFDFLEVVSSPSWLGMFAAPMLMLAFGPIAALGLFEPSDRPVKLVGPLIGSTLLMTLIWACMQGARWRYAEEIFRSLGGVGHLVRPEPLSRNIANLSMFAWCVLIAPTGLVFGAVIRRRWRNHVNWRWLQLAGLVGLATAIGSAIAGSAVLHPRAGLEPTTFMLNVIIFARWIPLLIVWITTLALVRARNSQVTNNQ